MKWRTPKWGPGVLMYQRLRVTAIQGAVPGITPRMVTRRCFEPHGDQRTVRPVRCCQQVHVVSVPAWPCVTFLISRRASGRRGKIVEKLPDPGADDEAVADGRHPSGSQHNALFAGSILFVCQHRANPKPVADSWGRTGLRVQRVVS